jgi:hypothetical protein
VLIRKIKQSYGATRSSDLDCISLLAKRSHREVGNHDFI